MKNLLRRCALPLLLLSISSSLSANPALWHDQKMVDLSDKNIIQQRSIIDTENPFVSSGLIKYRLLTLSENDFLELLESSGDIQLLEKAGARTSQEIEDELAMEISFPRPAGGFIKVKVVKDQLLSDEIAAKNPDIHTYSIIPETGVTTGGSVTFTSLGVNAAIELSGAKGRELNMLTLGVNAAIELSGADMIYIEAQGDGQSRRYASYGRKDNSKLFQKAGKNFQCKVKNTAISESSSLVKNITARLTGISNFNIALGKKTPIDNRQARPISQRPMRIYRLAIASTIEFTRRWGGGNFRNNRARAYAQIVTIINQIRQIYRRDLSVDLQLVSWTRTIFNNKTFVYDSAGKKILDSTDHPIHDPYTNGNVKAMYKENTVALNNILGAKAYDIGHVLGFANGTGGGSGQADPGSTCGQWKANGATMMYGGTLARFAVEYLAHELGHQLGGEHTFNTLHNITDGGCTVRNRAGGSAVEPGTGITIMSYANKCHAAEDIKDKYGRVVGVLPMFHGHSIVQIHNYTHRGGGAWCGTRRLTGNRSPVVTMNRASYTIPTRTPFILEPRSVTDPDNNGMTYAWEQIDHGRAANLNVDALDNALIRSRAPDYHAKIRTIPPLSDLIRKRKTDGERLPWRKRNMWFRLTARDNRGGVNNQDLLVRTHNTRRPFTILAPAGAGLLGSWIANKNYTVKWDVADTNKAPIYCTNVDIAATDTNGKVIATLAKNIANNGVRSIYMPQWMITRANNRMRIRVKCSNNIFFALSGTDPLKHKAD